MNLHKFSFPTTKQQLHGIDAIKVMSRSSENNLIPAKRAIYGILQHRKRIYKT